MSTTHKLPFTRFTKQANTGLTSYLSTDAAAIQAAALLQAAPWVESAIQDATFPPRAAVLVPGAGASLPDYDAYKYCGDVSAGKQKAYAGAVAYRYQIPAEALAGTVAEVLTVDVPLYVDRWLVDGVRLAAYVSDDPMPPSAWATIRAGDAKLEAQLPMTYTDPGGDRIVVDKNATLTVTMPVDLDAKKFLYIMVTLEDYETTGGNYAIGASEDRKFWIEGASFILGASVEVEFDRAVTAGSTSPPSTDYSEVTLTKPFLVTFNTEANAAYFMHNGSIMDVLLPSSDDDDRRIVNHVKTALALETQPAGTEAITALGATWHRAPSGSTTIVRIKAALQSMAGGLLHGGTARKIILAAAIPSYPDWMRVRMNLYTSNTAIAGDMSILHMHKNAWRAGNDISDADHPAVNLLSVVLSPSGHPANSEWATKSIALSAGRINSFLSFQIDNIVADPPATEDSALGLVYTPTYITLIVD
jgi:hypothetical protein